MRGADGMQESLFTVAKLDDFVPADHPLRKIQVLVNEALGRLNSLFNAIYAASGRDSIAPEKLMRALLLQVFYSIRSERQLMEQMNYNLLFRWFVGLSLDDAVWNHSVFSKNRDRLFENAVVESFFAEVMRLADKQGLLSKEHFSVDGTLIAAWASMKSFKPKDDSGGPPAGGGRNAQAHFHGEKRSNATHASATDPDARLYRKGAGKEARLSFIGHGLMENRCGLLVDACLTQADGHAERVAALAMIEPHADRPHRITLGADKGFDAEDFVNDPQIVGAQRAAGFGDFDDRVSQRRRLDFRGPPGELDFSFDAVLLKVTFGEFDDFGGDAFSLQILHRFDRRIFRHGQHPSHLAETLLGVDQIGHGDDVRIVLNHPVVSRQSGVEDAVLDIARHLLGADQHALDLGVVDRRKVRARVHVDVEPGAGEELNGGVLQRPLGDAELELHGIVTPSAR